ncbi:hypothetical protein CRG98_048411 [Punica granatum]|uniref:Uncharacterized protein n=1 Tax=Punica granatum TaxID=22663 RepID=A0A2I0HHN5_PUNGR|nr:hypothetical protein CRG98_048411 [Punica granatum]
MSGRGGAGEEWVGTQTGYSTCPRILRRGGPTPQPSQDPLPSSPIFFLWKNGERGEGRPRPRWELPRRPRPSGEVARVQPPHPRGQGPAGEPPNGSGPPPLLSDRKTGEEVRGASTRPGAPPLVLDPSSEIATSHLRAGGGAPSRGKGALTPLGAPLSRLNPSSETVTSPRGVEVGGRAPSQVGPPLPSFPFFLSENMGRGERGPNPTWASLADPRSL